MLPETPIKPKIKPSLLQKQKNFLNALFRNDFEAVDQILTSLDPKKAKKLIDMQFSIDVNKDSGFNCNPITWAIIDKNISIEMVDTLLKHNADLNAEIIHDKPKHQYGSRYKSINTFSCIFSTTAYKLIPKGYFPSKKVIKILSKTKFLATESTLGYGIVKTAADFYSPTAPAWDIEEYTKLINNKDLQKTLSYITIECLLRKNDKDKNEKLFEIIKQGTRCNSYPDIKDNLVYYLKSRGGINHRQLENFKHRLKELVSDEPQYVELINIAQQFCWKKIVPKNYSTTLLAYFKKQNQQWSDSSVELEPLIGQLEFALRDYSVSLCHHTLGKNFKKNPNYNYDEISLEESIRQIFSTHFDDLLMELCCAETKEDIKHTLCELVYYYADKLDEYNIKDIDGNIIINIKNQIIALFDAYDTMSEATLTSMLTFYKQKLEIRELQQKNQVLEEKVKESDDKIAGLTAQVSTLSKQLQALAEQVKTLTAVKAQSSSSSSPTSTFFS